MIELIGTIVTILAVIGVILNNRHKIQCFYLWIVSNLLSAVIHLHTQTYSLMVRDLIFIVLAIEGIYLWRAKRLTNKAEAIRGFNLNNVSYSINNKDLNNPHYSLKNGGGLGPS